MRSNAGNSLKEKAHRRHLKESLLRVPYGVNEKEKKAKGEERLFRFQLPRAGRNLKKIPYKGQSEEKTRGKENRVTLWKDTQSNEGLGAKDSHAVV